MVLPARGHVLCGWGGMVICIKWRWTHTLPPKHLESCWRFRCLAAAPTTGLGRFANSVRPGHSSESPACDYDMLGATPELRARLRKEL